MKAREDITGKFWITFSMADMRSCSTKRLSEDSGADWLATLFSVSSKHDTSSGEPVIVKELMTSAKTASADRTLSCAAAADLDSCQTRCETKPKQE